MFYQHYSNKFYGVYDDEKGKETLEVVGAGKQRPDDNEEDVPGADQRAEDAFFTLGTAKDAAQFTGW